MRLASSLFISASVFVLAACGGGEAGHDHHGDHDHAADTKTVESATVDAAETVTEVEVEASGSTVAESGIRQADSHVHGAAELSMVLDGDALIIELDTPLFNLTGFEHAPETDAQHEAVEAAEAILSNPASLFTFSSAAACTSDQETVDIHLVEEHHDEHEDDDHHGEHDDHDDHHDEHHEHADHGDHDEETHRDVRLSYSFTCANVSKLKDIEATFITLFPNMSDVEAIYIGPGQQNLFDLGQQKQKMVLK